MKLMNNGNHRCHRQPISNGVKKVIVVISAFLFLLIDLSMAQESDQQKQIIKRLHSTLKNSIACVGFRFSSKVIRESFDTINSIPYRVSWVLDYADKDRTFNTTGIVIDNSGTIILPDLGIKFEWVDSIYVSKINSPKKEVEYLPYGILEDFSAWVIKPKVAKSEQTLKLNPVKFSKFEKFDIGDKFYVVRVENIDTERCINIYPYITGGIISDEDFSWKLPDLISNRSIIANEKGDILGFSLDNYLWIDRVGRSSFVGRQILRDQIIKIEELQKSYQKIQSELLEHIRRFEIYFKPEKGKRIEESITFGLPVNRNGIFFLPFNFDSLVEKINEIKCFVDEKEIPATFIGLYKKVGAILVKVEGLTTEPLFDTSIETIPPGEVFYTCEFKKKFSKNVCNVNYNRSFRRTRGSGDIIFQTPKGKIEYGSWIVSKDARIFAFYGREKLDQNLEKKVLISDKHRNSIFLSKIITFNYIKPLLEKPVPHFDTAAVPVLKKEEERKVWFGIIYQGINKYIARAMNIEDKRLTNDGEIGFLVTGVYPDSPAEKIGIKPDDVILNIKYKPDGEQINLRAETIKGLQGRLIEDNYLENLLTKIGGGKKVIIEYIHNGEKKNAEVILEYGPKNYKTAKKYKDDWLGITVKELTYDMKYFQRLSKDSKGVIVSKVESGSKAQVAGILECVTIQRVNNLDIKGVEHFKEIVEKIKKSKQQSATFQITLLGQSKLVEIEK